MNLTPPMVVDIAVGLACVLIIAWILTWEDDDGPDAPA